MPTASASSSLPQKTTESRLWAAWDGAGAFASILCVIHCVGLPILLAAFPGMTSALPFMAGKDETFHQVVAVIATILAMSAFSKGYREHRLLRVILLGVVGCALLIIASTGIEHETVWTVTGSVLLVAAHFVNYQKMHARSHATVQEHGHSHCHSELGLHH
jgi:hypothetical protein